MVEINGYLDGLIEKLQSSFGPRLRYVGLQGSYLRGEATEDSDIDVMVLLDGFSVEDMDAYRQILMELGHYEKSCGFICDIQDFQNWNKLELCHVLHTTKDCYGVLSDFVSPYTREDVVEFTKMSLNNLYHALCHSYIHRGAERTYQKLPGLYKGTFFILQSMYFLKTGEYILSKRELLEKLDGIDREILEMSMGKETVDGEKALRQLFRWCGEEIRGI